MGSHLLVAHGHEVAGLVVHSGRGDRSSRADQAESVHGIREDYSHEEDHGGHSRDHRIPQMSHSHDGMEEGNEIDVDCRGDVPVGSGGR